MSHSPKYRWAVLFASFFSFVAFAFVFQLMPSLLTNVGKDFGVNEAELGLLMSIVMVPGIFLALPVGLLINRYGFRLLGFLSTILVAIGSLTTALADTFASALLGRFILGVGGAFIIVGTPTVIPQWFSREDLGKAMGFFGTNMPVATIIAFPTAAILTENFGWHYPFYVGALIALVAATIYALVIKEGSLKNKREMVGSKEIRYAVRNVEVWKASLVWMFFNTTAIAFLSWAKTLFQDFKGLDPVLSSILASGPMYAAAVFVPIFGWASGKTGRRKPFMFAGSIIMALALNVAAYVFDLPLLLSVIVLGIAAAMVPPIVMTVTAESLPSNLAGTGFSIVTLCQNIGIALSAPMTGYILQTTGRLDLTFFGASLFAFAGAITALTLKTK